MQDYLRWHPLQVGTGDIDPAYPVLRMVGDGLGGGDTLGWLVLRHVAFYQLGSALRSMQDAPGPGLPDALLKLPTGTERQATATSGCSANIGTPCAITLSGRAGRSHG